MLFANKFDLHNGNTRRKTRGDNLRRAGASGLLMAYKLQRHFKTYSLTVFEKNPEVSGTWFKNRSVCVRCSVSNYTWSFEPKLDWSGCMLAVKLSMQIPSHLKNYIKTEHQEVSAYWDNATAGHDVKNQDLKGGVELTQHCAIPGLNSYKGTLLHTANWDDSVDLTGKRAGLIGMGKSVSPKWTRQTLTPSSSSDIQVLPKIQTIASHVTTVIRTPTWISPVQRLEGPAALTEYRRRIERGLNHYFGRFLKNTKAVGCRRLTPGVSYLELSEISKVFKSPRKTVFATDNGTEYPVDFQHHLQASLPSHSSASMARISKKSERSTILSAWRRRFPNYLMFFSHNSHFGNGPVLSARSTSRLLYMLSSSTASKHDIRTFAPTKEAVGDFIAHRDDFMTKSVWADPCRSWYKNRPDGPIAVSGQAQHSTTLKRCVVGEWISQTELGPTADWGYCIREKDDGPATTGGKKRLLSYQWDIER
ncbi:putative sterigmatocystin biosynthesis monooxygenase [Lachnellula arida]|uniref:Putative sterigmatocystin biosynthesis monooxygenase n=1 Tax=Lachnellula arida TaxID=1316785 RepID=A0A8T9BCK1_9HELO|nr:putative sterigmatocystin biosynthesis monooxygenase [Lachnellula arida]